MAFKPTQLASGVWRAGYVDPVTHKRIMATRHPLTGRPFDYAYEAEVWATEAEGRAKAIAAGLPVAEPDAPTPALAAPVEPTKPTEPPRPAKACPTIAAYGAAFIARRAGRMSDATADNYGTHLRMLARRLPTQAAAGRPAFADRRMDEVEPADVDQYIADALAHFKAEGKSDGKTAVNARLKFLGSLYRDAMKGRTPLLAYNPVADVEPVEVTDPDKRAITLAEEDRLLAAAGEGSQLWAATRLALDTGLRWQEVFALRPLAIRPGYVVVSQVVDRASRTTRPDTKSHRFRNVGLSADVAAALAPFVAASLAAVPDGTGLLFPALDRRSGDVADWRTPWDYNAHRTNQWAAAMDAAGLAGETWIKTSRIAKQGPNAGKPVRQRRIKPHFGFHALRHTYVTRLGSTGIVGMADIQYSAGHASLSTTQAYFHASEDGERFARTNAGKVAYRQRHTLAAVPDPKPHESGAA